VTPRLSAVVVLAVVVVAAGLVALTRAPRRRPPAPRADQRAALASLPADAVARGRAFHRALRPPGYAARVLSLVVVLLLGLTPLAARIVAHKFDQKSHRGVDYRVGQNHLAAEFLFLVQPQQEEENDQHRERFVELCRMQLRVDGNAGHFVTERGEPNSPG